MPTWNMPASVTLAVTHARVMLVSYSHLAHSVYPVHGQLCASYLSVFPISVAVTLDQAVIIFHLDSCSGFLNVLLTPFFVSSLILLHSVGSDLSKMKPDSCLMKALQ